MEAQSAWITLGNWIVRQLHVSDAVGPPLGLFIGAFVILNLIMGVVTYMIWWLRKLVAWMQSRVGPQHVGYYGLLQTPADALKLMSKEGIIPTLADRAMFTVAPAIVFVSAYLVYATIPFTPTLYAANLNVGVVYVSAVSSITVIGIILGAWASNNKYALVAAFRSAAQMVSYEVPFALAVLGPVILAGSFSFVDIGMLQGGGMFLWGSGASGTTGLLEWYVFTQPIAMLCFFIAGLAENNVTPFDIVEAESEIVAGFHIEYSGMKFALFFLAEFANTMTLAVLTTLTFLGAWNSPFFDALWIANVPPIVRGAWHLGWFWLKVGLLISLVFSIRAALPRVRVDQLMNLGWKLLIPVTLLNLLVTGAFVLLGVPQIWLALVNWSLLGIVWALSYRRVVPHVDAPRVALSGAPAREAGA